MQIEIDGTIKDIPALWMEDKTVVMIDQTLIPHKVVLYKSKNYKETAKAIKTMVVRGAPTIGAAAAYGLVQAVYEYGTLKEAEREELISNAYNELYQARPTAVDLRNGLNYVMNRIKHNFDPMIAYEAAKKFINELVGQAKQISEHGLELLEENMSVLTHCNTGPLATIDYGTAIGPMIQAAQKGINVNVIVDETRPRLQGARLTTFELKQAHVPFKLISDNSAGYLMKKGLIDKVIVGADRVCSNGDIANKIGTYSLAVLCKHHNIPLYTAFPTSTFDRSLKNGKKIEIEQREAAEITHIRGKSKKDILETVRITPFSVQTINYAFDVTPAALITGYITPIGILKQDELHQLKDSLN